MSRTSKREPQQCRICNKWRPYENEHPWPKRYGGVFTIPLCVSCHDAIDRMDIYALAPELAPHGEIMASSPMVELQDALVEDDTSKKVLEATLKLYDWVWEGWYEHPEAIRIIGLRLAKVGLGVAVNHHEVTLPGWAAEEAEELEAVFERSSHTTAV